jgi:hypothetical protein
VQLTIDGTAEELWAGQIPVTLNGNTPLLLFCIDPLTYLRMEPVVVVPTLSSNFSHGSFAAWAFLNYAGSISNNAQAAALQTALWDLIVDGGDGFSAGRVRKNANSNTTIIATANDIIRDSVAHMISPDITIFVPEQGPSYSQTLIGPLFANTSTPEPAMPALVGASLLALALLRRR